MAKFVICTQYRLRYLYFIFLLFAIDAQWAVADSLYAHEINHENACKRNDSTAPRDALTLLRMQGVFDTRDPRTVREIDFVEAPVFFRESGGSRLFTPRGYMQFLDSWLFLQLQTGYPFASARCVPDSARVSVVYVSAEYSPGPLCLYDSLSRNDLRLSSYFYRKIGGFESGMPYNDEDIQRFRSRMLAVDGYALKGAVVPSFYYGRFVLDPSIIRQKRDRLSGLLGLATQANQKPVLTGEADAAFYDLFGHGVSFYSRWRRFQARSQELFAGTELPYLLGAPFVAGLHFGLEKYDTIYTRFKRSAVLRFPASREWRWSLGVERTDITGLGIDKFFVKTRRSLPQNAPSRATVYTAALEKVNLQTVLFPIKGWSFRLEAGVGSRIWLRDAGISSVVWKNKEGFTENVYDSLQRSGKLKQNTFKIRYNGAFLQPVFKNWILYLSIQGEEYRAPNINFAELSRWGGINSIRGFNEQRIFANTFHMANAEFRFMAGQSGFIAPFVSGAVFRNATLIQEGFKSIYSLGLAGGLKTGAGILRFAWALGNEGQGFTLRDAKFHLGLSNAF